MTKGVCAKRQAAGGVRRVRTHVEIPAGSSELGAENPRGTRKGGIPFPEEQDLGRH